MTDPANSRGSAQTPPVGPEVDLRDFAFMPLDVARLRDSAMAVTVSAEAFRAAILLWCAAWHQVPAASLPTNDRALAQLAGFGRDLESWLAVKDEALYGFGLCDDGRLYHAVIAEKAQSAWTSKLARRARTAEATAARQAKRKAAASGRGQGDVAPTDVDQGDEGANEQRDDQRNVGPNEGRDDERHVHQGTGTGTGTGIGIQKEEPSLRSGGAPAAPKFAVSDAGFAEAYGLYPRHVAPDAAQKAYKAAIGRGTPPAEILAGVKRYAAERSGQEQRFTAHMSTWLNAGRWRDGLGDKASASPPDSPDATASIRSVEVPLRRIRARVNAYIETGTWPDDVRDRWGPAPGEFGCCIPPAHCRWTPVEGPMPMVSIPGNDMVPEANIWAAIARWRRDSSWHLPFGPEPDHPECWLPERFRQPARTLPATRRPSPETDL